MKQEPLLRVPAQPQIMEIGDGARAVTFADGEILVTGEEGVIRRIPILDIAGVVAKRSGPSWSAAALSALSGRAAGIVICDDNFRSRMLAWPMPGRRWPRRIRAQMSIDGPFARHVRRRLLKARREQRDMVLAAMGKGGALQALRKVGQPPYGARRIARSRRLADLEDQIDRNYWSWLAGSGFRRNPAKADGNAIVNLAHTTLRIEATRAIHFSGLHPALGLAGSRQNGGLVDDLMLPYRPIADLAAALLIATGQRRMDERARAAIDRFYICPMHGGRGMMQVRSGLEELAQSLAHGFESGDPRFDIRLPAVRDPSAIYDRMMGSESYSSPLHGPEVIGAGQ